MLLLTADDGTELDIDNPELGYAVQSLDIGAPEVREVVENRPGADGVRDSTRYVGGRAITINLVLVDDPLTRRKLLDDLGRFLYPGIRSTLTYSTEIHDTPRTLRVRADQWSALWDKLAFTDLSISFKAVEPFAKSVDARQESTVPQAPPGGTTFNITFNFTFPATGTTDIGALNEGNVPADWSARIFGPITDPRLVNLETGQQLKFVGLKLLSGEYITLDSLDRSILAGGLDNASRYGLLDFTASKWWRLLPGVTRVQLRADDYSTGAQVELTWNDAWLS